MHPPLGSAHQTAHARVTLKTLEVLLSNSTSMKAGVDFMHAIKHWDMTLANYIAGGDMTQWGYMI
jgi:hypothetical protein